MSVTDTANIIARLERERDEARAERDNANVAREAEWHDHQVTKAALAAVQDSHAALEKRANAAEKRADELNASVNDLCAQRRYDAEQWAKDRKRADELAAELDRVRSVVRMRAPRNSNPVAKTPTYQSWRCMRRRCQEDESYIARGITVCERWKWYENFLADMGPRPSTANTIDRIDNSKGYEPGNCRWATAQQQSANRSNTRILTHDGRAQSLTEWARELGFRPRMLAHRIESGWTTEEALTAPRQRGRSPKTRKAV